MNDHYWLILAALITLASFVPGAYSLGAKSGHSLQWQQGLLGVAFLAQSGFLYQRGNEIGHCPITNLFETMAFLAWSLLLTYLLIGGVYRMSILGFLTSPMVFLMNFFALATPMDHPTGLAAMGWELEMHASLSVMAYGTLGIAALAGILFLVQDRQLKRRDLPPWFYRLPALGDLETVQYRLLFWGFLLLSIGLLPGLLLAANSHWDWVKLGWSVAVWTLYLVLMLAPRVVHFSGKKIAWISVAGYSFVLLTFWGINSLSASHRFNL